MKQISGIFLGFLLAISVSVFAAYNSWYGTGAADDVRFVVRDIMVLLSGEWEDENVIMVAPGPWEKEEIAIGGQTDQALGTAGSTGDYLSHCIVNVVTAATASFGVEDGTNTAFDDITLLTGAAGNVGSYTFWIQAQATTAAGWEVTTGAGATAACFGRFDTSGD